MPDAMKRFKFEKRLKAIIGGYCWSQDGGNGGYEFGDIVKHIDESIQEALAQARAEERERIEQEITRVCKYAEDYRNYDMRGVDWQSILHPTDLLSSLEKPVTKKD